MNGTHNALVYICQNVEHLPPFKNLGLLWRPYKKRYPRWRSEFNFDLKHWLAVWLSPVKPLLKPTFSHFAQLHNEVDRLHHYLNQVLNQLSLRLDNVWSGNSPKSCLLFRGIRLLLLCCCTERTQPFFVAVSSYDNTLYKSVFLYDERGC